MIKEFWHLYRKLDDNIPADRIALAVKHTIARNVKYVPYDKVDLALFKVCFADEVEVKKPTIIEYTKFEKNADEKLLSYILVCPKRLYAHTERALRLAGFKPSDVAF